MRTNLNFKACLDELLGNLGWIFMLLYMLDLYPRLDQDDFLRPVAWVLLGLFAVITPVTCYFKLTREK